MRMRKAIPSGIPISGPLPHQFWLCIILAIIGIAHVLFYLMLILKHMASVYSLVKTV